MLLRDIIYISLLLYDFFRKFSVKKPNNEAHGGGVLTLTQQFFIGQLCPKKIIICVWDLFGDFFDRKRDLYSMYQLNYGLRMKKYISTVLVLEKPEREHLGIVK